MALQRLQESGAKFGTNAFQSVVGSRTGLLTQEIMAAVPRNILRPRSDSVQVPGHCFRAF